MSEYKDIVLIIHECNERAGLLVLCGAMWWWRSRHQAEGLVQRVDIDKDILASLRTISPLSIFLILITTTIH